MYHSCFHFQLPLTSLLIHPADQPARQGSCFFFYPFIEAVYLLSFTQCIPNSKMLKDQYSNDRLQVLSPPAFKSCHIVCRCCSFIFWASRLPHAHPLRPLQGLQRPHSADGCRQIQEGYGRESEDTMREKKSISEMIIVYKMCNNALTPLTPA